MGGASTKAGRRPNHMCINNTPVEHYPEFGLYVKREDLCCPTGPHFSKTRGVYAHIAKRPEKIIGVLDTAHSQGGWAVAQACKLLDRQCMLYYPQRKAEKGHSLKPQQRAALDLGAGITGLAAGRSAVLYHQAKKHLLFGELLWEGDAYMMPNALKLPEMITETVAEFKRAVSRVEFPDLRTILVSASSATIAAGVILGAELTGWAGTVIVHMGYSRPENAVRNYIQKMTGLGPLMRIDIRVVDEGYAYADVAKPGVTPPFPSNEFYDLKAFRWWMAVGRKTYQEAIFWNIG
jgi:hypothetical protein